ncbi:MAG: UDP-N-acetylmuramate--L-alanine ligase [Acidimicrobiales bacterium]
MTSTPIDLSSPRRVHIIGLGGSGMSAIAEILIGTGHEVTGSDIATSKVLERLVDRGVIAHVGRDATNLGDPDLVAISTAIPASNPEVVAANERGIPVLRRAELLTAITREWTTIAVAGTHGKTTTSAMLTIVLQHAGLDPAYIVGGDLRDLGRGAAVGQGQLLVVEADESDGTFVELVSDSVIVTNVEPDHLEHYGSFDNLSSTFDRFVAQAPGAKVVCIDDPGVTELIDRHRAANPEAEHPDAAPLLTYGTHPDAMWRIVDPMPTPSGISFDLEPRDDAPGADGGRQTVRLGQPGMHNARNAAAAVVMAVAHGVEPAIAAAGASSFGGVGRRFEPRGEANGIRLVDDYAHLPTEVASALAAARSLKPARLIAVFQPHRYSRTEQLHSTFGDAFVDADHLIVTGIYSANEAPRPGITGSLIADRVRQSHPDAAVDYVESLDDVEDRIVELARPGDLILTLGAGDLTAMPSRLLPRLDQPRSS